MNAVPENDERNQMAEYRRPAPDGFAERVMARLPQSRRRLEWDVWPAGFRWVTPALAGAAVALLLAAVFSRTFPEPASANDRVVVHFVFYAPEANRVELVGDFTEWEPGRLHLDGPDEAGRWNARVELPAGRYEYLFLVDGRSWVTDPLAETHRPDGFGNINAVMNL